MGLVEWAGRGDNRVSPPRGTTRGQVPPRRRPRRTRSAGAVRLQRRTTRRPGGRRVPGAGLAGVAAVGFYTARTSVREAEIARVEVAERAAQIEAERAAQDGEEVRDFREKVAHYLAEARAGAKLMTARPVGRRRQEDGKPHQGPSSRPAGRAAGDRPDRQGSRQVEGHPGAFALAAENVRLRAGFADLGDKKEARRIDKAYCEVGRRRERRRRRDRGERQPGQEEVSAVRQSSQRSAASRTPSVSGTASGASGAASPTSGTRKSTAGSSTCGVGGRGPRTPWTAARPSAGRATSACRSGRGADPKAGSFQGAGQACRRPSPRAPDGKRSDRRPHNPGTRHDDRRDVRPLWQAVPGRPDRVNILAGKKPGRRHPPAGVPVHLPALRQADRGPGRQ